MRRILESSTIQRSLVENLVRSQGEPSIIEEGSFPNTSVAPQCSLSTVNKISFQGRLDDIMGHIEAHHILSTVRLHIDDIIVLALLTRFLYSFLQFFYLPPRREPGYELFFASPQEEDGLFKVGPSQRDASSRDIGNAFARWVSRDRCRSGDSSHRKFYANLAG